MATNHGVLLCHTPRPSPPPAAATLSRSLSPSGASPSISAARSRRGRLAAAAPPPPPRCVATPYISNAEDQTEAEVAMGYTMTEICDKFIEFFMHKKPETKDWRKVLVFREEWRRYRKHFYKRCQVRIDMETDSSMKQKLVVLARKVKKIDDEVEKHMELFTELRDNPVDINAIVARRRKAFTGEFFRHLNFLVNAYNGLDERDGVVRLGAKCLSAIHAYDSTLEQLDIESAQSKFDDILNSSSLEDACDKIKSLAKAKELDSSLILLINRAWAAAKDSTTMKDKVKDIMYHIYTTTKESLKIISPPEMKLLKYLLNIEDPEDRFGALATAFSPGDEREAKDDDALYTVSGVIVFWPLEYHIEDRKIKQKKFLDNSSMFLAGLSPCALNQFLQECLMLGCSYGFLSIHEK
ncbi:unnamed protein product [Urochloa decumbens]|uniref:Uncharacterized protein n=2 Tax=Urochloa decumbens TaxID=240449 RepID=A0ABC8X985_9POAL